MLALQQKTNEKIRDLELVNEEKSSLLRAALLDRENLSPELLELKRAETLRQIRDQIQSVVKAPAEAQPKVLETTSLEIAETLLSSEAALDKAKKVSISQISHVKSLSSAFDAAVSTMRSRHQLDPSFSAATLISPASAERSRPGKKPLSEISISTAGTGQTTWGRMTQFLSPKRRRGTVISTTELFTPLVSDECSASLSWPCCLGVYLARDIFHMCYHYCYYSLLIRWINC